MGNSLDPRKVTVGVVPVLITNNFQRTKLDLVNVGNFDVGLGKNAAITEGFPLPAGAFQSRNGPGNAIYAISPNGSTDVWIWEEQ